MGTTAIARTTAITGTTAMRTRALQRQNLNLCPPRTGVCPCISARLSRLNNSCYDGRHPGSIIRLQRVHVHVCLQTVQVRFIIDEAAMTAVFLVQKAIAPQPNKIPSYQQAKHFLISRSIVPGSVFAFVRHFSSIPTQSACTSAPTSASLLLENMSHSRRVLVVMRPATTHAVNLCACSFTCPSSNSSVAFLPRPTLLNGYAGQESTPKHRASSAT